MFNKKYKKDCNVDVGEKSGDIATNNLSKYVTDNNVDLNEICNYLNKDPKNFK